LWATVRLKHATQTTLAVDPNATNVRSPFFTTAEMSDITQKLDGMRPQEAQQFLARLAAAVPKEAIALIGDQMSKKDPVSDAHAGALSFYKRGMPGDGEIAHSVIDGMTLRTKGGEDGKTRIDVNAALFTAIDNQLGASRAGMNPDAIRMQNNVVISHYIGLTANAAKRDAIDPAALNKAITDIVGKRSTINGADTLIPRELETYQARNGIAAIGPADVTSLRAASDGKPITDALIRQQGQLVPYGDGTYTVVIPDPLRSARVSQVIDNNTGKPWVIDINRLVARGDTTHPASRSPNPPVMPRATRGIPVIVPTEPVQ